MATEQITIAELDINTDALTKSAVETKKAIDAMNASQKELKKSTEDTTVQQVKNEAALKNLKATYNAQKNTLAAVTDATNKQVAADKALTNEINKEIKTENQATASNKKLLAIRKEVSSTTEKGRKQVEQINAKIDKNNKLLKENASEQGKARLGVGGYEAAIKRAFPQVGSFIDGLKAQKAALKASTAATTTSSTALKGFRIALISTGVGAIVVALGALIAAFSSTQKGADKISKALAPIKGAFQGIIGIIQDISTNIFGQLGDRWTVVSGSILKGIDFIRLGWAKLSGNIEEASEITARIAERTKDIERASESLAKKDEALNDIRKKSVQRIKDAADAQKEIVRLQIEIEKNEANLVLTRARLTDQIKEQELLAKDTALTATQRNEAADEALRLSRELADAQKDIINLRIEEEELTQSLNDSGREDLKKLNELKAEAIAADTRQKATELRFLGAKNAVLKEDQALEKKKGEDKTKADEEELKRIENFANQKRELQNQIDLENAVTDEEKAILKQEQDFEDQQAELEQLEIDQTQKDQLEALMLTVQETKLQAIRDGFTEKEIIAEITVDKKKEKIRKDELKREFILQKQKLSILSNTFGQTQELLGKNSAAGKAAGIAQATVNTFQGITEVWKTPSVLPEPIATAAKVVSTATVLASGLGAVRSIKGVDNAFYEGGQVQVPTGTGGVIKGSNIPTQRGGDNILASVDGTHDLVTIGSEEMILNPTQQARAGGSAFFKSIGVPGFQTGGQVGGANLPAQTQAAQINMDEFAEVIADKVNAIKIVAIESDISNAQALQVEIVDGANI